MTPNVCQTVKGSLSASLLVWAWVLCGLGLQMAWCEALTLLCPSWGLSLVICIPMLLTFSSTCCLEWPPPSASTAVGSSYSPLTDGYSWHLVLGIQGSDPRIQPIADGVNFSIQHGLNLWMWSPDSHPQILVSIGDPGAHPGYQGKLHFCLLFQAGFPQGVSFSIFSFICLIFSSDFCSHFCVDDNHIPWPVFRIPDSHFLPHPSIPEASYQFLLFTYCDGSFWFLIFFVDWRIVALQYCVGFCH